MKNYYWNSNANHMANLLKEAVKAENKYRLKKAEEQQKPVETIGAKNIIVYAN